MNRHINFHGKVRRYNHNLSYRNFFSGEIGELRPVWLEDAVPGDTFQYKPELRLYFAPLVYPVLSAMKARVDVFFVPNRLSWFEWEPFITGGPDDSLNPSYPSIRNVYSASTQTPQGGTMADVISFEVNGRSSLLNSLGHPWMEVADLDMTRDPYDLIPFQDFLLIWDDYYRDEEKEDPFTITPDGRRLDVYDFFTDPASGLDRYLQFAINGRLPKIAWSKDYFTSASLEQQRGGDIPLLSDQIFVSSSQSGDLQTLFLSGSNDPLGPGRVVAANSVATPLVSSLTVNGLRYLYSAANWLNNNVVGGTRYIEQLRRRYRVVSSDARLQRPEMVGSISVPVNIDVVTQTSSTVEDATSVQALGDRAGKASVIGTGRTLTYSAEEFGYFIAILHIAPKAAYFQGIRRNLQREDRFDFWSPEFERLPQREIRNNEIYATMATLGPEDGGIFGYTGQFNEYRHHNDEVHGDFTGSLLAWTTARQFSSLPSLASSDFLRVDNDAGGNNRIFAVPDTEFSHIFGVVNNIVLAKREISNVEPSF